MSFAPSSQLSAVPKRLSDSYIRETLSIYEPKHIYIHEAWSSPPNVRVHLSLQHYPFARPGYIDYVTASSFLLYLSQAGYILARVLLDTSWPLPAPVLPQRFFTLRDSGDIVITGLTRLRFTRRIPIGPAPLILDLSLDRAIASGRSIYSHVSLSTTDRAISGRATIALLGALDDQS